jgi:hypothetical protein
MNFFKISLLVFLVSCFLTSCGPSGTYSDTVPTSFGDTPTGYDNIELNFFGSCIISHEVVFTPYSEKGEWEKIEDGVRLSGFTGRYERFNGNYYWDEHPNAKGVGKPGKILRHYSNSPKLFPLGLF